MRSCILVAVAIVIDGPKVAYPASSFAEAVNGFNIACFTQKCEADAITCSVSDPSCASRMDCLIKLRGKSADVQSASAPVCFQGLDMKKLSDPEKQLLSCATKNSCLELHSAAGAMLSGSPPPAALAEISSKLADTLAKVDHAIADKPDYAGLKEAEDSLERFTEKEKESVKRAELKRREIERHQHKKIEDYDSSFVEESEMSEEDAAAHADAEMFLDSIDRMLEGFGAKPTSSLIQEGHGAHALTGMDDTTLVLALGAMTGAMGQAKAAAKVMSAAPLHSPIRDAYATGVFLSHQPSFIADWARHFPADQTAVEVDPEGNMRSHP